eukprot:scaffold148380_cov28-Tisochrysis_lutea.AAC.4
MGSWSARRSPETRRQAPDRNQCGRVQPDFRTAPYATTTPASERPHISVGDYEQNNYDQMLASGADAT